MLYYFASLRGSSPLLLKLAPGHAILLLIGSQVVWLKKTGSAMPRLSFIFPYFLWLLLLLPPLWLIALLVPRRLSRWRYWSSLLLRTLGVLAVILGLAGAQVVRPVGAVTTVFLLDGSDSVALSQRARAEAAIAQALTEMPRDDRAAIIVFGQQALVERTPSGDRSLGQVAA